MTKYRVVFIESPYDYYEKSADARRLLGEVFKLKLDGYKSHHEFGIIPISGDDFFANHLVICKEVDNELIPVSSFKSITNKMCDKYKLEMPTIGHNLGGVEHLYPKHIDSINKWFDQIENNNETVGYTYGWTIDPSIKDKKERQFLVSFSISVYYFYYKWYQINHIISAAFTDFNVDKLQKSMGFKYWKDRDETLGAFKGKSFGGKDAFFMYLEDLNFNKDFIESTRFFETYWEDRIDLTIEQNTVALEGAA